jgi:uncharacterized protein DUF5670
VSEKSWQMNKTVDKYADENLTQPKETSIGHVGGALIHLLLVIAIVVLVINLIQGRRGL